jgi:hypothetical protein
VDLTNSDREQHTTFCSNKKKNTPVQPHPLHVSSVLLCLDAALSEIPRVFSTPDLFTHCAEYWWFWHGVKLCRHLTYTCHFSIISQQNCLRVLCPDVDNHWTARMSRNIVCYYISQVTTEERKSNGTCGEYREVHVLGILEALADWVGVNQEEWSVTFQKLHFKRSNVSTDRPSVDLANVMKRNPLLCGTCWHLENMFYGCDKM